MPDEATVREATAEDADAVFILARAFVTSFELTRDAFEPAFASLLGRDDALLIVACEGDVPIAYLLGCEHGTLFAGGPVGWVEEVMVAEPHRRAGVGQTLMRCFETWASERSCRLVALATRRAAPFYLALGYEESATYFRKVL